jgi:hypothetical protein
MAEWTQKEQAQAQEQVIAETRKIGGTYYTTAREFACQRNRAFAALTHLRDKCRTYGGPKGGKMDLSEANEAIAACTEGK